MPPDEPTEEERQEELPEDNGTPFSPADPNPSNISGASDDSAGSAGGIGSTHPQTDTNIQPEELYDEGIEGAAEVEDRSSSSAVTGYDPEKDAEQKPK